MIRRTRGVLHVDDDRLILKMVSDYLQEAGYQVTSLHNPQSAIDTLAAGDLRVVILDIEMPGINGLDLLRQIKAFDGGIQVIMLTGLVTTFTLLESMRLGAEACLFKPVKNYATLGEEVGLAFAKIERWTNSLHELAAQK